MVAYLENLYDSNLIHTDRVLDKAIHELSKGLSEKFGRMYYDRMIFVKKTKNAYLRSSPKIMRRQNQCLMMNSIIMLLNILT